MSDGCSACGWGVQDCFFANCMHPAGPDDTRKGRMDEPQHRRFKPVLETELWVVVMTKNGVPIGFNKVASGRFYHSAEDATEQGLKKLPLAIQPAYSVKRVLAHFQELQDG